MLTLLYFYLPKMSSGAPFLLSASEQYDGTNWLEFKTKIRAAAKQRGVLGYLDGTIPCPPSPAEVALAAAAAAALAQGTTKGSPTRPSTPTPSPTTFATAYWGSTTPTYDEWQQRDAWTQGLISLNVKNAIGLGIKLDGTAAETYASIAVIKDAVSDLGCITAEAELNEIKYSDGSDMDEHIAALRTAWMKANGQGAGITDTKFRMVVLKSLPSTWLPFIGSLYTEVTSAGVIARVSAHSKMILSIIPASGTSLKALSTSSSNSKLRNPHLKCTNCGKAGHELTTCFQKGGGKEGQFPEWWRGKKVSGGTQTAASATTTHIAASAIASTNDDNFYAFSTQHANSATSRNRDGSLKTFGDSAASDHYFGARADFHDYVAEERVGETATGEKFRILGRGTVRKVSVVNGKRINISFMNVLHAPDFTHNLVSIGRLDRAGYTIQFAGGKVAVLDQKGVTVVEGPAAGTMYELPLFDPTPDDILPTAYISRSLSKATDLETWHHRLGHVSEATIMKMMKGEMVIGLTNETLTRKCTVGKCEDCIFGKHARRPFDYEVVQVRDVLALVAIDLWGPARVRSTGGKLYMMLFTDTTREAVEHEDGGDGGGEGEGRVEDEETDGAEDASLDVVAEDADRAYGLAKSHTTLSAPGGNVEMPRSSSPESESYVSAPSSPVIPPSDPVSAPPVPRRSGRIAGDAPTIERVRLDAPLAMSAEKVLTPDDDHWVPRGDVRNWTDALLKPLSTPIPPSLDPHPSTDSSTKHDGDTQLTAPDEKSLVVVLDRALYGTVDGARNWSIALSTEMKELGYYESRADQSVRTRLRDGEHTITATYSDDVTGATTTREGYEVAMRELGRKFQVKDMGELKFVIGMGVDRDWDTGIAKVHVRPFLKRTLERFRMTDCAPKYTPLPVGISLTSAMSPSTDLEKQAMANVPYREALGCIMYAQYVARPDLSFQPWTLGFFMNLGNYPSEGMHPQGQLPKGLGSDASGLLLEIEGKFMHDFGELPTVTLTLSPWSPILMARADGHDARPDDLSH
ncbi:hypothetical protein D9619_009137 [Psilocybe cf. subviscida]|uniref:CCHC-type domain-containing protein n=1 Tax=Psilocybe cf. subviscida TaxID=2480587 RepID=A0A8H5BUQ2_9AGAR|nr:hypothetical protein D9619_009137 [Psilocybe cf. subviscida]